MKRKGIAVLGLSVALALAGATASLAEGWQQSGGNWVYYNSSGNKVTNEWRKGADGLWRYLNYNGNMALNTWVDDEYYVDSNGIMVAGKWMQLAPKDDAGIQMPDRSGTTSRATERLFPTTGRRFPESGIISTATARCRPAGQMTISIIWETTEPCAQAGSIWKIPMRTTMTTTRCAPMRTTRITTGITSRAPASATCRKQEETITKIQDRRRQLLLRRGGRMQTGWICVTGDEDNFRDYRYLQDNGKLTVAGTPPIRRRTMTGMWRTRYSGIISRATVSQR